MKKLNKRGCIVCETINMEKIPITDTSAIERSAGCLAKINTPNPIIVVMADNKMDDFTEQRHRNRCC